MTARRCTAIASTAVATIVAVAAKKREAV